MIAPAAWTCSAIASTTFGPNVSGGTKCPSMMSTWITRAPAASTSPSCEPSLEKSAARIDGATSRERMRAASLIGVVPVIVA